MSNRNDGGSAFPGPSFTQSGNPNGHSMGMTLRDWFAATCDIDGYRIDDIADAAAFLGIPQPDHNDIPALFGLGFKLTAKFRYMQADAMLAARGNDDA